MGKALDGLKGIKKHSFDEVTRIFTVDYYPAKLSRNKIIKSVESAGNFSVINWKVNERN
ncbi:MAG: cation transporter [Candidatus Marinimicrobia bacterium]|nr:cation transporter [Candidatus Neomarinimicrobiota bacterium]